SYRLDKKSISLLNTDEIVIDFNSNDQEGEIWSSQLAIVKEYLDKVDSEYQLMLNLPSEILSTRYLNIPIKNKKKALQMLPFQIEEDLPYSMLDCHWAESITLLAESTDATVGIVKKEHFEDFYNSLKRNQLAPKILSNDVSNYNGFIQDYHAHFPQSFCIINLGHQTTRGFYFHNGKLVTDHHSHTAGSYITDTISKTYSISYDEATIYKHQNSFLLLEDHFDKVNENQREFAKVMDLALTPLLNEIKRWEIGFRVKYGANIKDIYICGGTSNIKNIKNYLAAKLNCEVHYYDPFPLINAANIDKDEKLRRKFSQVATLAINAVKKSRTINFLRGEYTLGGESDLPIESMIFIGARLGLISLLVCFYLTLEMISYNQKITTSQKFLKNLYKNPLIGSMIGKPARRRAEKSKNFQPILKKLEQNQKHITQEVNVIQSSLNINSLSHLTQVTTILSGHDIEITEFSVDNSHNINLSIKAVKAAPLLAIQKTFKKDKSQKWIIDYNKSSLKLTIAGKGKL
ncbi:MAG: pilus assembly protein PilM, partial [Halobacteriovoraceae bacterium]|nr:pilus assembly protein PilM [Halobacteriovoraceae bacterium]